MQKASISTRHSPDLAAVRSSLTTSKAFPRYLHKRSSHFYFRRKIPSDVVEGFPQYRDQVWKALGTELLEKARLLLAVEVTEFELTVAKLRKQKAHLNVSAHGLCNPTGDTGNALGIAANELLYQESHQAPDVRLHSEVLQRIEKDLEMLRRLTEAPKHQVKQEKEKTPSAPKPAAKAPAIKNRPTMLHLFEFWSVKQTRPRTIQAAKNAVLEFHELNCH
jgi:hypothetical protein